MDKDPIRTELRMLMDEFSFESHSKFSESRTTRNHLEAAMLVAEHRAYEYCALRISELLSGKVANSH